MAPKESKCKPQTMMIRPISRLYLVQIREISPKYKNEEDRGCLNFHNYGSD